MRKIIGYLLIASPFIVVAILAINIVGYLVTVGIYGVTALIVGVITLGVNLVNGNGKKEEVVL